MDTISKLFAAIAAVFTFKSKKLEQDNAPAMQARASASTDQAIKDAARTTIANGDTAQLRKDLAE